MLDIKQLQKDIYQNKLDKGSMSLILIRNSA